MNKCGLAWGTALKETFHEDIRMGMYLKQTIFLKKMRKVWLTKIADLACARLRMRCPLLDF